METVFLKTFCKNCNAEVEIETNIESVYSVPPSSSSSNQVMYFSPYEDGECENCETSYNHRDRLIVQQSKTVLDPEQEALKQAILMLENMINDGEIRLRYLSHVYQVSPIEYACSDLADRLRTDLAHLVTLAEAKAAE